MHHLPHSVYVAAVIASIVHILNSFGLPLELPATSLLANVAEIYVPAPPRTNDVRRHLAVVEIDQERFERLYGGTSPLNRCQLKTDLETLLANPELRLLAVDLDLSPVDPAGYAEARRAAIELSAPHAGAERRIRCDSMTDARHGCQCQLESLLEDPARSTRIVTITPLSPAPGRSQGMPWANPVDFPNVEFGAPDLFVSFGMVHDYVLPPDGYVGPRILPFAELVTRRMCNEADLPFEAKDVCGRVPRPERPSSAFLDTRPENRPYETRPISFFETRHLHNAGRSLGFDDACLVRSRTYDRETRQEPCDIRFIMLGGSYGIEDRYLTPLGVRSGFQIHAAIAAQMRAKPWHGTGFLVDIALGGLLFGPVVSFLWQHYFRQRTQALPSRKAWQHPKVAYRWLILLAVVFGALVLVLVYASSWIYARWGVWISPMPMALGMLVEAVVSGSVHVANRVIREVHTTAYGAIEEGEPRKRLAVLAGRLPRVVAIGVIAIATYHVLAEVIGH